MRIFRKTAEFKQTSPKFHRDSASREPIRDPAPSAITKRLGELEAEVW